MAQEALSEHTEQPTWARLSQLLKQWPSTAEEVHSTIVSLHTLYPWIPGPHINFPDGPWPTEKPRFVQKPHLHTETVSFQIATDNLAKAGMSPLTPSDEEFLRYVLCFPLGWSATSLTHHNDSWVHYVKHRYPHIEDLQPILDDMTWPEEVGSLVASYGPGYPGFFLFANSTSFYFFDFETQELLNAGNTLEEVYLGLRDGKWSGMNESGERWNEEPDNEEEYDATNYFPIWGGQVDEDGETTYVLAFPLKQFIPHLMNNTI